MLHSDAGMQGWTLAHSFWSRETVAEVAGTLEKSRFRRIGPHSARKSALVSAQLEVKSDGHWRPRENLSHHRERAEWELDTGLKEVPWALLRRRRWHVRNGMCHF